MNNNKLVCLNKKLTFFFFFLFIFSSFVTADKTVIQEIRAGGLDVVSNDQFFYPVGEDFEFSVHVYNSTGYIENSVDCMMHIYNDKNEHLYDQVDMVLNTNSVDYEVTINSTVTSQQGSRPYKIYCNNSEAGFASGVFYMTPDGQELQLVGDLDYLIIILILMFISGMSILISTMFTSEEFFGLKIIFFIWGVLQVLLTLPIFLLTLSNYTSPTAMFDWFVVYFTIDIFILIIFVIGYWLIVGGSMLRFFTKLAKKKETRKVRYQ